MIMINCLHGQIGFSYTENIRAEVFIRHYKELDFHMVKGAICVITPKGNGWKYHTEKTYKFTKSERRTVIDMAKKILAKIFEGEQ